MNDGSISLYCIGFHLALQIAQHTRENTSLFPSNVDINMLTIPTELQARSTAPTNPASATSQPPSKKRNAEEANPIAENDSDTVQRSDPSLTDPTSSSLLPNG